MKLFHKKKKSTIQEVHIINDSDKPDKEEIDRQFELLLDELAIPHGVKRDEMQNWDLARKWMLLSQKETPEKQKKIFKSVSAKNVLVEDNPQAYISALKSPQREKHLASLKVILTGKELSWAIVFLDLNGLECILDILEEAVRTTPKTAQKASEILDCVACVKTLLNSQIGMTKCMERPQFTKSVACVLSCTDELLNSPDVEMWEKIMCSALNILAAMCLVPNGHRMVVTAFNKLCTDFEEEERFACILKCIWHCAANARRNNLTENYYALLLSCISFLNVVINAPYELQMRCALRSSILAIGAEKVLQELRGIKDDIILTQLDTFYSTAEEDCAELLGDKVFGNEAVSELLQVLAKKITPTANGSQTLNQSIYFILHNLNAILSKDESTNCEFSIRELESQSYQILLQHLYAANHNAEEWVHMRAVSDPENHATAVATLPWMPNSVRVRRNTVIARQIEEPEITPIPFEDYESSPHLGPPPPIAADLLPELLSPPPYAISFPLPSPPSGNSSPTALSPMGQINPSSESPRSTTPPPTLQPPPSANFSSPSPSPSPSSPSPQLPSPAGIPPPPPSLPANRSPDTQFLPGVKMRNLQWKKVNEAKLQNTIWGNPEFRNSGATSLFSAADYKLLEDLFGENSTGILSPRMTRVVGTNGEPVESPKKPQKITLLDPKRSNNIAIMLSKIKISFSEITSAVENMDSSKLSVEQVGQMLKLLPTPEETSLLSNIPDQDKPNLGKPELYLLEMMKIPKLNMKLECWHFSLTFATKIAELKMGTVVISNASKQLVNSKKFSQLLLIILQLGNFINAGGFRGSAAGVKLDCLNKLRDLKAGDKRQTLLHFLVNFCLSKHPELLNFFEEITFTEAAKNVSLQALQAEYTALCTGFTNFENYLQQLSTEPFAQKLSGIAGVAKVAHEGIKTEFAAAQSAFESTISFFGEDPTSPEEFFGNIYRFHTSFAQTLAEINRSTQSQNAQKRKGGITKDGNGGGQFLDNIITKIHDSKIFRDRTNISEIMVSTNPPRSLF